MIKAFFNRLQKRAAPASIDTAWPFGQIAPLYGTVEGLATTRRCISLYSQFLNLLQLEPEHYFTQLLKKPHPAYKKADFMEALCWELLLNGQFVCRLIYNNRGLITRIDPYRHNTARAYVVNGDYGDPESVAKGFYYRSTYNSRIWWPDEALHIKDSLQSRGDLVNGYPRSFYFKNLFDAGVSTQNATLGLSLSGGRGPVMIEGLPLDNAEQSQTVRENFSKIVQSGLKESTSQVMGLPVGYKAHRLLNEQSHSMITWLAERNDYELAKLWDVPVELMSIGRLGAQAAKEVWRSWIRFTLRGFVKKIADAFSDAVNDGTVFQFKIGATRFSDQREASLYFSQLVQAGVLPAEEARKMLEENL